MTSEVVCVESPPNRFEVVAGFERTGDGLTTMYFEACQSQFSFVAGVQEAN